MATKVVYDAITRITQHYGENGHSGVDIGWRSNEAENQVFAHSSGTVVAAVSGQGYYPYDDGTMATYGNYVDIDHGNGYKTRYAHLRTVNVSVGQSVTMYTKIGIMGESGHVTARHLHFEVHLNGTRINPEPYLSQDFDGTPTPADITYQAHDSRYGWNPSVSIHNRDEYAGNFGYNVDGIYLDVYRVRVHDMVTNEWLPWVKDREDYAGNLGHAIDAIQSDAPSYRVHIKDVGWTNWTSMEGTSGTYGQPIDSVQFSSAYYV